MNKQELIERIEGLKNIFENECEYVKIDFVIELASELDEPEKVKVPQFVADVIEGAREQSAELEDAFEYARDAAFRGELGEWFMKFENRNTFARAWLDGYEVEKEKRYKVVMLNIASSGGVLTRIKHNDSWIWIDTLGTIVEGRTHTRKELEDAGFGWVFDCEGIEIEEVE